MTRRHGRARRAVVAALALVALGGPAVAQGADAPGEGAQSWISGVGDDNNPCERVAPCKTIAGALLKTDPGGTISALDPGGYGWATITTSITIDLSSASGSVLHSSQTGLTISAGADDRVVIRGIEFTAAGCTAAPGVDGILVTKAGSVVVENSTFSNFTGAAINVANGADSTPVVTASGLRIRNGCGTSVGVLSAPTGGGSNRVQVGQSVISGQATGVRATSGGAVTLLGDTVWGNTVGIDQQGTGTIAADRATHIVGNGVDGTPSWIDPRVHGTTGDTGRPGAAGAPGPTGATGAVGARGPDGVSGLRLRRTRANAAVGAGVTIGYVARRAGAGALVIRRDGRVVARVSTWIRKGTHGVRWNGRLASGRPAPSGRYTVTLSLAGRPAAASGSGVATLFIR